MYNYTNTITTIKVGKENDDLHSDRKFGCHPVALRSNKPGAGVTQETFSITAVFDVLAISDTMSCKKRG